MNHRHDSTAMHHTSPSSEVGIVYEAQLALEFTPDDNIFDTAQLAKINDENATVLDVMEGLEGHVVPFDENDPQIAHTVARLEVKLNLVLNLLNTAVVERKGLPAAHAVELGSTQLSWQEAETPLPTVGDVGSVALYFPASPATPLRLTGTISAINEQKRAIVLRYHGLDESIKNALERFIFRQHRRHIARQQTHH